jgi:hypothetical protein
MQKKQKDFLKVDTKDFGRYSFGGNRDQNLIVYIDSIVLLVGKTLRRDACVTCAR